jgi:uncharacterized protein (TIGR00730 family)
MPEIRSVAVFCGSRVGASPAYRDAAVALGEALAHAGMRLIYGGGRIGLMGALADGALSAGGTVIGVIPDFLQRWEVAHAGCSELIVTDTMHTRKTRMFELADAFVTLPGGLGTFDETFEILTWRQLKLHDKPILICDIDGSSDALIGLVEDSIRDGFAPAEARTLYERVTGVAALMERLARLHAVPGGESALL